MDGKKARQDTWDVSTQRFGRRSRTLLEGSKGRIIRTFLVAGGLALLAGCVASQVHDLSQWTQFVQVDGQPEAVPIEWLATPEGRFAHSIKIPNPVPKDSGYRRGISSQDYFLHLCKQEAGEFIFKTIDGVEGFHFMRPPKQPTDDDLMDRFRLEAPEIERLFQLLRATPVERAQLFVNPPWANYKFVEESSTPIDGNPHYVRLTGYRQRSTPMQVEKVDLLKSRYGVTWRGLRRFNDREMGIAGGEWIVIALDRNEIVAVLRNYGFSGKTRDVPDGIWWLNAIQCPNITRAESAASQGMQLYDFVSKALKPSGKVAE